MTDNKPSYEVTGKLAERIEEVAKQAGVNPLVILSGAINVAFDFPQKKTI